MIDYADRNPSRRITLIFKTRVDEVTRLQSGKLIYSERFVALIFISLFHTDGEGQVLFFAIYECST